MRSQSQFLHTLVCGHPVVTGEAMMQGRSTNRVRWLLDSGSRSPGSSLRLDPGPSAGTTPNYSPRRHASQAPRCRARVCGHRVVTGEAMIAGPLDKPGAVLLDSGSRIPDQVCDLIRVPGRNDTELFSATRPGEFAQQCAGGILARTKPIAEPASAEERRRRPTPSRIGERKPAGPARQISAERTQRDRLRCLGRTKPTRKASSMATAREFGETNPTQERSASGGGLRRKRLKRPASSPSRARVCGHPVVTGEAMIQGRSKPGAVVTGFRLSDPGSSLRLDPGPSAGTTPNYSPLPVRGESARQCAGGILARAKPIAEPATAAECHRRPTASRIWRNEPNAGALDQWRRFTAQAPKPPCRRVSQAPRCRARVCGHPVVTGEAMMQGRSTNRVRWLLDSGSRIPDQVCDLIRVPRPERHRIILLYPSGRVCAAMRGRHFGPNKANRKYAALSALVRDGRRFTAQSAETALLTNRATLI